MESQTTRDRREGFPVVEDRLPRFARQALVAMYAGLALTVLAILALVYDVAFVGGLDRHLHQVYDGYVAPPDDRGIAAYLLIVGALGVVGWLWTLRAVRRQPPRARAVSTVLFALGAVVAVAHLTVTEYEQTVLPTSVGIASLLPCLPGLVAVVLLWRRNG